MTERGYCKCGCGEPTPPAKKTRAGLGHVKGEPIDYILGHNRSLSPVEYIEDPGSGCWIWQRNRTHDGYGRISVRTGSRVHSRLAHRHYYELHVGPIPSGMHLDHLCRNPACVNPAHLEPVTPKTNSNRSRKTKLQDQDVAAVRRCLASDEDLATVFGVTATHIRAIRARRQRTTEVAA